MSTATETAPIPEPAKAAKRRSIRPRAADQCVALPGIGWDGYRQLLRLRLTRLGRRAGSWELEAEPASRVFSAWWRDAAAAG